MNRRVRIAIEIFFVVLVVLVIVLLSYVPSAKAANVEGNACLFLPTVWTTQTWESTETGIPTGLWSGTGTPTPVLPICAGENKTPTGGLFGTVDFGPTWTGMGNTPTGIPSLTSTAGGVNEVMVELIMEYSLRSISEYQEASGELRCVNEHGDYIVSSPDEHTGKVIYGHDVECLGEMVYQGWDSWYATGADRVAYVSGSTTAGVTMYYDTNVIWEKVDNGHGSYLISETDPGPGSVVGHVHKLGYLSSRLKGDDITTDYIWARYSNRPFDPVMPSPTVGSPTPCVTPGFVVVANNPVAWFSPPTYRYGSCITLLSKIHIPLGGAYGLDDLDVGPYGFCPVYVGIGAAVMGVNASYLIAAVCMIFAAFGVINEFRS